MLYDQIQARLIRVHLSAKRLHTCYQTLSDQAFIGVPGVFVGLELLAELAGELRGEALVQEAHELLAVPLKIWREIGSERVLLTSHRDAHGVDALQAIGVGNLGREVLRLLILLPRLLMSGIRLEGEKPLRSSAGGHQRSLGFPPGARLRGFPPHPSAYPQRAP